MIIKEIRIDVFGGVENLNITLDRGINLIYGENEKGKSTTESFIKIMLYGFSKKKINGKSERKKYIPFKGGFIGGELLIENKGRKYIIKRTFGLTKKDDTSVVIDVTTGVEASNVNRDEPGKTFLAINRSTFEKTLFISQLGVIVEKDKEEEIMEKITALFGCGEEEVPVAKAIEKLNQVKRSLSTVRGAGSLDLLKKREQEVRIEEYEAIKLCEQNLHWEEELYSEKLKRSELEEDITKLEVYKKYLKRVNLQREYKDIAEYLRKSEELKKREEEIAIDITYGNSIITNEYLEGIKAEYLQYESYLEKKNQLLLEKEESNNNKLELNNRINEYEFINEFQGDIREKIINLKYEQDSLKEKVKSIENIIFEVNRLEKDLEARSNVLNRFMLMRDINEEVGLVFKEYENKLYKVKSLAEEDKGKEKNLKLIVSIVLIGISILTFFMGFPSAYVGILLLIISGYIFYNMITSRSNSTLKSLMREVEGIERKLNRYLAKTKTKDYSELMQYYKKYNLYNDLVKEIKFKVNEKRQLITEEEYMSLNKRIEENNKFKEKLLYLSKSNNLDQVLEKVSEYERLKLELRALEIEIEGKYKSININNENLNRVEREIRSKLRYINLHEIDFSNLNRYLNEYGEKIKRYNEVHNNLRSIEGTYNALLKDRDIEKIKEDLKDIIREDNKYSYENEEEVEQEEKRKSKELLECEKTIKDLENKISTRLLGKRNIVRISEELDGLKEKINKEEKKKLAIELAMDTLEEAVYEVKKDIGPEINKKIAKNFEILTGNKYKEVLLSENYEMMVRDNENLFEGNYLSNGAMDQLYLALRIALIELLYKDEEKLVILDDALIQYDDERRKEGLLLIEKIIKDQVIIFTCQKNEQEILSENKVKFTYIEL